jgi:putative transposase
VACGVDASGQREVIGLDVGAAETEAFWREFLRSLVRRGLAGVQLVVSDAHEGLKAAIAQVLSCPWQRCTVHFLRDALGHCPKDLQQLVGAAIRPIFRAGSLEDARRLLEETITHLEGRVPKVARLLLEAEPDLLAFYAFPAAHRSKLRSTDESFKARVALSAGWEGVSLVGGRGRPRSEEQGLGAGSPAAQLAP